MSVETEIKANESKNENETDIKTDNNDMPSQPELISYKLNPSKDIVLDQIIFTSKDIKNKNINTSYTTNEYDIPGSLTLKKINNNDNNKIASITFDIITPAKMSKDKSKIDPCNNYTIKINIKKDDKKPIENETKNDDNITNYDSKNDMNGNDSKNQDNNNNGDIKRDDDIDDDATNYDSKNNSNSNDSKNEDNTYNGDSKNNNNNVDSKNQDNNNVDSSNNGNNDNNASNDNILGICPKCNRPVTADDFANGNANFGEVSWEHFMCNFRPPNSAPQTKPKSNDEKDSKDNNDDSVPQGPSKGIGMKNLVVIGSFDSHTFHYSFKNQADPLDCGQFPIFGFPKVPGIGTYGNSFGMNIYNHGNIWIYFPNILDILRFYIYIYSDPVPLRVLLQLQMCDKLLKKLPKTVYSAIKDVLKIRKATAKKTSNNNDNNDDSKGATNDSESKNNDDTNESKSNDTNNGNSDDISDIFEGYVCVHRKPRNQKCGKLMCNSDTCLNLMYHPWLYNNVAISDSLQITDQIYMGIFEPKNLFEMHVNDVKSEVDRGVTFNKLGLRSCFLHGLAFSPCNAQFRRNIKYGFSSFYAIGCTKDYKRCILTYHVFTNDYDNDDLFKSLLKTVKNVDQLKEMFQSLGWADVYQNINNLANHF